MALTIEWTRRIENWRRELSNQTYRPLGAIALEGFVTTEQLSAAEAVRRSFSPMPAGTPWGAKWEYGWFRASVELPKVAAGRRIVLRLEPGAEALLFVGGKAAGAVDRQHREVTLTRKAKAGERFEILAEAYAGHGPVTWTPGPVPPGRVTMPEPGPTQSVVGESSFGIWEEEVYQLAIDVETLWGLRENLDPDSLRVAEIDRGLRSFTTIVDVELPRAEMLETVRRARRELAPLLACVNGSTAPVLYGFGHAHIDVAWLWPLAETERKAARTLANQLALIREYRSYRFLQSQPQLYLMLKERYPELYGRVTKAAKEGRIVAEGGMWLEADTNITGGESLIRQFLHGMRFFREELGVENEILWLPDVFGYSGALPQILRGVGISYFSTAKIYWNYHGGDPFPYTTFFWVGIDGSSVLASFCTDYNSRADPASVIARWKERPQKDGISARLFPFGFGDGGGGPNRDHLEFARRLADLEGAPRVRHASPLDFFRFQERHAESLPRYVGELYFQAHRGTYTSQARIKRANRRSEILLREAELWASFARVRAGARYPGNELARAWRLVLLNQFHDIIPGSSIERVYTEALGHHEQVRKSAAEIAAAAMIALGGGKGFQGAKGSKTKGGGSACTVFNSLGWKRTALVELPEGFASARDRAGEAVPTQRVGGTGARPGEGKVWAEVGLPSCGWTSLQLEEGDGAKAHSDARVHGAGKSHAESKPHAEVKAGGDGHGMARAYAEGPMQAGRRVLENEQLKVAFDDRGQIASILVKGSSQEFARGPGNVFRMYRDVPAAWDAWDVDSMYALTPVALSGKASVEALDAGPLVARLRITRKLNESDLVQIVSLRRGSRRVDFDTTVEWRESHKLLKVDFRVDVHAEEALHEIQFGHLRRPNHRSRPFDVDRFEVCNHRWTALAEEARGVAVLNDCKYGVNVLGDTISLSLLRAPLAPDMRADKGTQHFTYALLVWEGPFVSSGVVREGYELNTPALVAGPGEGETSLVSIDAPGIVLETVKMPEDGDEGSIVLRMYESLRTQTRCTVRLGIPAHRVLETDLRERTLRELVVRGGEVSLDFRPFEIKTLLVTVASGPRRGTRRPAGPARRGDIPRR